ncbi:MAG: acetyl-CoA carboxylase biotin carboxylase subunit [bacterium]|nr:acetyl-CoA carboxylase biotin carboxylase subunit [bacterium]
MFKKILIANRGEIALRIIRAAKELDIQTVAVYSEEDVDCLHTKFADEVVCIGPARASESYLNIPRIISAAEITGADAIHPGYGFLAESANFAEICEEHGITFIGPNPEAMRKMGDKTRARQMMKENGIPVIPGYEESITSAGSARNLARELGYPVIIKARGGGGGKGMRIVKDKDKLEEALDIARTEAEEAFSDDSVYLEKYIVKPRHIEIQILADRYGNIIHLGERECSIQFRHQKLIEESPSPIVDTYLREKMGDVAIRVAKNAGYTNVGTVEFLVDMKKKFYFMEMNTRIQVEHLVTEWVTGIDLVKEQIRLAAGEKLDYSQADVTLSGHAIECRINACDPDNHFSPSPGEILALNIPGGLGIRVDTHIYQNYFIPRHYDSLIAKLTSFGKDRKEAISRMKRALNEFIIEGVKTTIPFHRKIMDNPQFLEGDIHTHFLDNIIS